MITVEGHIMSENSTARRLEDYASENFDWEELVRNYPIPALLLAAIGGFVLARGRGDEILAALSGFAAARVSQHVNELLGEDVLDR